MREQCEPATGTQVRITANPIGPCYYYKIDVSTRKSCDDGCVVLRGRWLRHAGRGA